MVLSACQRIGHYEIVSAIGAGGMGVSLMFDGFI
jgi:hypothetical protein